MGESDDPVCGPTAPSRQQGLPSNPVGAVEEMMCVSVTEGA